MVLVPTRARSLRRSIVARLVAVVGLFSMASFVLVGAAEIWRERSELLRAEHERARAAVATSAGALALAIWTFDQKTLEIAAASLTREGPIVQVDIVADGKTVLSQRRTGAAASSDSRFSTPLLLPDRAQPVGELHVTESYEAVDAQILRLAWQRLGVELGKVLGVALGVFLLLHTLVTRRLGRLADRLQELPADDPPAARRMLADECVRDDEIAAVVQAVLQFQHDRAAEARRRELAETHLRERMEEMAVTLGALGEGVIVLDAQLGLRYANAAAQRLAGMPADWETGEIVSLRDLIIHRANGERVDLASLAQAARDGEHAVDLSDDLQLQPMQGEGASAREVRLQIIPLRSSEDLASVLVIHDQSEAVRLHESERARALAEGASRAKSDFLSRMSHELRTPLNA
ncbi:MAG TPA: PAS domain-containing protein, partial [Ideonella sp.]|nr:PAS domain-containing protein [Ideonella sp.]